MYGKCKICKETYVEVGEEICIDCFGYLEADKILVRKLEDEYLLESVSNDELGFIDVHVSESR